MENSTYPVIIFDFDGTIAETLLETLKLFNEVAPRYDLPIIKKTDLTKIRNLSAKELIREYHISGWKLLRLTQVILPKLKENISNIALVPGIAEVLAELKQQGFSLGIVTSNAKENVELFLKKHHLEIDFVYAEKNFFGKARVLAHLLKKQKINKQTIVYVGDEVRDIEAAHQAGLKMIAVTWGFNSPQRLETANPEYLVTKPEQLLPKIFDIFA
jgi:phosphoglycolate phosphatase